MAETKTNQSEKGGLALRNRDREAQLWSPIVDDPFEFMNRMSEEFDRAFDRLWRDFGAPRRRSWLPQGLFGRRSQKAVWAPAIEAFQKGDTFVVRAELPGLKKDDIEVELTDDAVTIRGERREEREEEKGGYYHTERSYGEFYRVIPLPEGVISESAKASFRNGVLEITMQAAPPETRGRRLEIKEASESEKK